MIAQKIISKAENRYASLKDFKPSDTAKELALHINKDPRFIEAVLSQTKKVIRHRNNVLIVEHKLGFVHANAGIDRSNIDQSDEKILFLPKNPNQSAKRIGKFLESKLKIDISIIISDTMGRAFRNGIVGFAIGAYNIECIRDERGSKDIFNNTLQVTQIGVADELASAASLIMGQTNEKKPLVIINGYKNRRPSENNADVLIRDEELDLFR